MAMFEAGPYEPYGSIFKRCVSGCPTQTPLCPSCPTGQVCLLIAPTCTSCQRVECVPQSAASSPTPLPATKSGSKPNVPAIAGGVIAGVFLIAVATYLVWRFCIKTKRQQYQHEEWVEDPVESLPTEKDFAMRRDARASTQTVGSIASTVLTRASNIIQIAYIPGVTNRSAPTTPGLLVPPVPPIPIALSSASSSPKYEHEHFFMPGDLRDSTYSGMSDRTSYARNSVASTIYGKNAIVSPLPAQTVIRGRAAVVSVKSNTAGSSGELTPPPVPFVDHDKYNNFNGPPSPAFSVGSTFLNNATAATQISRPQVVNVAIGPKKQKSRENVYELDATPADHLLDRDTNAINLIDDTPNPRQGPFRDLAPTRSNSGNLSVVSEESTKKAHGTRRTPFGDEHEVSD